MPLLFFVLLMHSASSDCACLISVPRVRTSLNLSAPPTLNDALYGTGHPIVPFVSATAVATGVATHPQVLGSNRVGRKKDLN